MVLGYTIFIIWPKQTVPGFSLVLLSSSTPLHPSPALFGRGQPIQIIRWICKNVILEHPLWKMSAHPNDLDYLQNIADPSGWSWQFAKTSQSLVWALSSFHTEELYLFPLLQWGSTRLSFKAAVAGLLPLIFTIKTFLFLSKQGLSIPISKQSLLHPFPLHNIRPFVQLSTNSKPLWHRSWASRK